MSGWQSWGRLFSHNTFTKELFCVTWNNYGLTKIQHLIVHMAFRQSRQTCKINTFIQFVQVVQQMVFHVAGRYNNLHNSDKVILFV